MQNQQCKLYGWSASPMAIDTYFILIVIAPVSTDQGHKELCAVDQVHINSKKQGTGV